VRKIKLEQSVIRNGKLYLTDGSIELLKWFALILMGLPTQDLKEPY
jgi:hypothetical protein